MYVNIVLKSKFSDSLASKIVKLGFYLISVGDAEKRVAPPNEGTENPAVNHHASSEYINNSPELKKEKPKEDTPV